MTNISNTRTLRQLTAALCGVTLFILSFQSYHSSYELNDIQHKNDLQDVPVTQEEVDIRLEVYDKISRNDLQEVPVTQEDVDIKLEVYDEIFRPDSLNLRSLKEMQKEIRIRQDCTKLQRVDEKPQLIVSDHADSNYVTVSCTTVHYRAKSHSLENIRANVAVGILSAAASKNQRNSIRETWAKGRDGVFFIVAGPWEAVEEEYNQYGDLIWVDQKEKYRTQTSGLTFKTYVFLAAMYDKVRQANPHIRYFFKTDDDVYVNFKTLYEALETEKNGNKPLDYWGRCYDNTRLNRSNESKFFMSYATYPFAFYPPYCIGLGYAISQRFLDCAVKDGHLEKVRFIPNEDVAVGMLAERCGMEFPRKNIDDLRNVLNWNRHEPATMKGKIMQHGLKIPQHMNDHHLAVRDDEYAR